MELSTTKGLFNLDLNEGTIYDPNLDEGSVCDQRT